MCQSLLQERMQEVRAERQAGGASPQRAAALASPRPSRGRRMSQAGGLVATGDPRVSEHGQPAGQQQNWCFY
jgi:hypothetical protein